MPSIICHTDRLYIISLHKTKRQKACHRCLECRAFANRGVIPRTILAKCSTVQSGQFSTPSSSSEERLCSAACRTLSATLATIQSLHIRAAQPSISRVIHQMEPPLSPVSLQANKRLGESNAYKTIIISRAARVKTTLSRIIC